MFRVARHEGGTAVPVRCTGVPLGERRVRRTVPPPTKRGAKPRYFRFADSRFSVAKTSKMFAAFSVNVVRALGRQCHACAQKKAPDQGRGRSTKRPSLPLIWLAALAWTALLATLPGLLLLLTRLLLAAAALLAARATLTALTATLVLLATLILLARLLFVGVHISAPSVPSVT